MKTNIAFSNRAERWFGKEYMMKLNSLFRRQAGTSPGVLLWLAVLCLFTFATSQGQNTIYVWSSTDGDPSGISGTIVLNSPSYSGDFNASDIVSLTLSDTVSGTYNVDLATDIYARGGIMAWGPTGISEMVLGLSPGPASSWFLVADLNKLYGFNPYTTLSM
jgi:hypothetical protein